MRIRWLDHAVADLLRVRIFIAQQDPGAAAETAQRIRRAAAILSDYPAAGRAGRVPNTRELVISGTPYILPYRVCGEAVEILRVLHSARQWPEEI